MDLEAHNLLADIRDRLERIENLLLGNGQEGIIREVAKNTEFRRNFTKSYRAIAAAAVSGVLAALAALARSLIH